MRQDPRRFKGIVQSVEVLMRLVYFLQADKMGGIAALDKSHKQRKEPQRHDEHACNASRMCSPLTTTFSSRMPWASASFTQSLAAV